MIADRAVEKWSVSSDPIRVDAASCLVDPMNRKKILMNGVRVHTLLNTIMKAGFSLNKVETGIVVDISSDRRDLVVEHNRKIAAGDQLIPQVEPEKALFTVVHTNHFSMIARCFFYKSKTIPENLELGITTPDGRLSLELLKSTDPTFYNYLHVGHRVIRINADIVKHPTELGAIIASRNHDLAMRETEGELLMTLAELIHTTGDVVPVSDGPITHQTLKTLLFGQINQAKVQFPHLQFHCESMAPFVAQFGFSEAPFLADLVEFHSEHVRADKCRSEAGFWDVLATLPKEFGWPPVAFAKDNWATDKVSGGICKGVPTGTLHKAVSKDADLKRMNDALSSWRKDHMSEMAKLPSKVRARVLGRFDILSSRVHLYGTAQCKSPEDDSKTLYLSLHADVAHVSTRDLALELENHGLEHALKDVKSLEAYSKPPGVNGKRGGDTVAAKQTFTPVFNDAGDLTNMSSSFEARGYRVGNEVTTTVELRAQTSEQKEVVLSRRAVGRISHCSDTDVLVIFRSALVQWKWESFPFENLVVTKAAQVDNTAKIDKPENTPLVELPVSKKSVSKLGSLWP